MAGLMQKLLKPLRWRFDRTAPMSATSKVCLRTVNSFPQSCVEQFAVERLRDREQIPLSELAEQLAEALYRDELRHGGWVVDLGLLPSSVFFADALQELQNGNGGLWKINQPNGER